MSNNILIGADPEVFVKQNGVFCSGYGLIEGTKKHPSPVNKGAVQVDGMALEFNIDPAADRAAFVGNINTVMAELRRKVEAYEIVIEPVADFSPEVFAAQPEEAIELGCDPDMNAWTMDVNNPPNSDVPFRTAAGHIHLGYTENQDVASMDALFTASEVARQLDFYLALPSLLYDDNTKRRELYGQAGAFRIKPYGMEYRVLSNKWLANDHLKEWVYDNAQLAYREMLAGNILCNIYGDIQDIINQSDVGRAMVIVNKANIKVA